MPTTTKEKTLEDLFLDTLKDVYHAEKQLLRALPKMAKAAEDPELKHAFEHHLEETDGQVQRLEKVFEGMGRRPQGKPCAAMQGLVDEGREIMEEFKGTSALDPGLVAAAQAVEHYEIARYGTLIAWAGTLGMTEAKALLQETLEQEKAADKLLTGLARQSSNRKAA